MKNNTLHSLLGVSVLVLAGSIAAAGSAHAATYTDGDLLLGFRSTSATNSVIVDIGTASNYDSSVSNFTLSLGDLGSVLSSTFGSNWYTQSSLLWEVIGTQRSGPANGDAANTLYASRAESPVGTRQTAWLSSSNSSQATTGSPIFSTGNTITGVPNAGTLNNGIVQDNSVSNSYNSNQVGVGTNTSAWGRYDNTIEGDFSAGVAGTALDLFRATRTGASGTFRPSGYQGTFTIDTTGSVTYATTSVPEPTTITALLGGAGLLGLVRRRRQA